MGTRNCDAVRDYGRLSDVQALYQYAKLLANGIDKSRNYSLKEFKNLVEAGRTFLFLLERRTALKFVSTLIDLKEYLRIIQDRKESQY